MTKITKTQSRLIDEVRRHAAYYGVTPARGSVIHVHGRGAYGRRIDQGSRQRDAMFGLEKLGLIRIVDRQFNTEFNRGNAVTYTCWVFEVVNAQDQQT